MSNALLDRARLRTRGLPLSPALRGGALAAGVFALVLTAAAPAVQARPAPNSFADLAAKVSPAVVNISVERRVNTVQRRQFQQGERRFRQMPRTPFPENSPYREFFRRFFGDQYGQGDQPNRRFAPPTPRRPNFRARAVGSGFIIDPDGYIVTNNHVVARATKVEVTLNTGEKHTAKIVGRDPKTDIALLKIEAGKKLPHVEFGDSNTARVGDWIMAVGNPYGLGGTVTAGIISARGRDLGGRALVDFLQIDAPINRGNSGGPTFDMDGKVVGVNTAIYSPNGGSIGLGFAVPSNVVKKVVSELRTHGKIMRGWLGVQIQTVTPEIARAMGLDKPTGALVAAVMKNSPAEQAGLRSGDVVLSWDGKQIASVRDLARKVALTKINSEVKVVLRREGKEMTLAVKVGRDNARAQNASADTDNPASSGQLERLGLRVSPLRGDGENGRDGTARHGVKQGLVIVGVQQGSPAAEKGLRRDDLIVAVGATAIRSVADAERALAAARKSGREAVLIKIVRDGRPLFVGLPLS